MEKGKEGDSSYPLHTTSAQPPHDWLWVTIPVGIGTSVPSFEARAGSAPQPSAGERPTMLCICLWSFGIVWLVDWLQLTIINILSIIWCLICASHFVSSPSSPFFRLLLQPLFFLCLASSLLTSSARAMTFCFDCEVRFRFVWFVLVVLALSTDLVYVIRRACSASCSNKGRRKTSKKYIANIKSKLRAQMQTSFVKTKSELAPKLEPEYECE